MEEASVFVPGKEREPSWRFHLVEYRDILTAMKILAVIAFFALAVGMAFAGPDRGRHNGWPNKGHPNEYANPHPHAHP